MYGGFVGGGIDPAGQAGDDGKSGFGQTGGQPSRHADAKGRGVAGTDHADGGAVQQRDVAQGPQDRRSIGDVQQRLRIVSIAMHKKGRTKRATLLQLGLNDAQRADLILRDAGGPGDRRQGVQCRTGRPVFGQKPVERHRADPAGANEAEPVETVILRLGCGVCGVRKLPVCHPLPRLVRLGTLHRKWLTKSECRLERSALNLRRLFDQMEAT